ncbi:hypothetical protein EsH8_III_001179 [Colletotrichum jinshuiense]
MKELLNEEEAIRRFNEFSSQKIAWVVAPIPGPYSLISSDLQTQWIVLVELPMEPERYFPDEGDACKIGFVHDFNINGKSFNPGMLMAERIPNPFDDFPDLPQYSAHAAFNVTMEYLADPVTKEKFHPLSSIEVSRSTGSNALPSNLTYANAVTITLRIESNPITYEAELMALSILTDPKKESNALSEKTLDTFEYLLDFRKEPRFRVNLFKELPHMDHPADNTDTPAFLKSVYSRLNRDHKHVYEQLRCIPAGLALILGCPGAGKTAMNAFIAAMALHRPVKELRDGKRMRKPVKILYLLDVNYPCDDAANRVYTILKDAGITKSVIRVRGCAREMRRSAKLHPLPRSGGTDPDFTVGFLKQARTAGGVQSVRDNTRAPSLDEAAWDRYDADRSQHQGLAKLLDKLGHGAVKTKSTARELRTRVAKLYFSVIKEADFIATTPVGASGYLSKMFSPDLVFLDEAAHARELTALIPLAFYSPHAFILTGDTRQTRPFVEGSNGAVRENVYAKQLMISTMERADLAGALYSRLMISHRMYGNLQLLASELFYDGLLKSGIPEAERYPDSVRHIQTWLMQFTGGQECDVPRILLNYRRSREAKEKTSFYNPIHEIFIKQRCYELLEDKNFKQVDKPDKPGRIMIITPYKAALARYKQFIKVLPPHFRGRLDVELRFHAMEVRTVDSAQGHEADFVFVDTVRTKSAGFLNDPKRLCVMLTRARIGEMVLMHEGMTKKWCNVKGDQLEAEWTTKVYNHCRDNGQLHHIG